MSDLKLVEFPSNSLANVPDSLRALAVSIESGRYGKAHNLAWVIDCGDRIVEIGLLGQAPEPALTAHFLFGVGMRNLEGSAL